MLLIGVMVIVFVPVVLTLVVVSLAYPTRSIGSTNHGAPAAATTLAPIVRMCLVAGLVWSPIGISLRSRYCRWR